MRWRNLLFAHWEIDPTTVGRLIPAGLELDLFDGRAYVGAVPFVMEGVSPRLIPRLPRLHRFPELNLRTYVKSGGKPGVWFFSLDAGQKLAIRVARRFFRLPYFDAQFQVHNAGGSIEYSRVRTHSNAPGAIFSSTYRPAGPAIASVPGTLDSWLTDRYCLYAAGKGHLYRGDIDHQTWPLQPAVAELRANTLGDWLGIELGGPPATLHFSEVLDVRAWILEPV